MKKVFAAVLALVLAMSAMAFASAETFEELAFDFVDTLNAMLEQDYPDNSVRFSAYSAEDEYSYIFYTDDENGQAVLMLMGDDNSITGGAAICNDAKSMNTAVSSVILFFMYQKLSQVNEEINGWLTENLDAITNAMKTDAQYIDGYATSNDMADVMAMNLGNGTIQFVFNYYPEGRSAFYDGLTEDQ